MSKNNDKYISVQLIDDSDDEKEVGFEEDVFEKTFVETVFIEELKEVKKVKGVDGIKASSLRLFQRAHYNCAYFYQDGVLAAYKFPDSTT